MLLNYTSDQHMSTLYLTVNAKLYCTYVHTVHILYIQAARNMHSSLLLYVSYQWRVNWEVGVHHLDNNTDSEVSREDTYFQFTIEELEQEDLAFLLLMEKKRHFVHLSVSNGACKNMSLPRHTPSWSSLSQLLGEVHSICQYSHGKRSVLRAVSYMHKTALLPQVLIKSS